MPWPGEGTLRALLLTNPASHTARKDGSLLARVATPDVVCAQPDFDRLEAQIADAAPPLVVVEGGDGTVEAVTTAILRAAARGVPAPKLMLVPGGMTDLVARIIGVRRDPDLVARLIERGGTERPLRPLRVEGPDGPAYGYFLSTGAVPRGIDYARERLHARGAEGALAVAGTLASVLYGDGAARDAVLAPSPMAASLDGEPFGPDHKFALVTTLPRLMLGLDPFWGGGEGAVRVTLVRGDNARLKRHIAGLWLGIAPRHAERDGYVSKRVDELWLDTPAPTVLDGEALPPAPMTVTAGPALTFVTA